MMPKPGVYWTESWNPVTGCTPCSPACDHCWAKATAARYEKSHSYSRPFSDIVLHPDRLDAPLHWVKPRVAAVTWMGDLFHEDVPDAFIGSVFSAMRGSHRPSDLLWVPSRHTFLVLTKRPERMRQWLMTPKSTGGVLGQLYDWPFPNVWIGTTVWNQPSADKNILILLDTPARHRWLSYEPALDSIEWEAGDWLEARNEDGYRRSGIEWLVAGCESGVNRRPAPHSYFRRARRACQRTGTKFYLKQLSQHEDGTGKVVKAPTLDGKQHLELAWEAKHEVD